MRCPRDVSDVLELDDQRVVVGGNVRGHRVGQGPCREAQGYGRHLVQGQELRVRSEGGMFDVLKAAGRDAKKI